MVLGEKLLSLKDCAQLLQVSGLGAVMMMPLISKLSDVYGRKSLLTIPMILTVLPFGTYINQRDRIVNLIPLAKLTYL